VKIGVDVTELKSGVVGGVRTGLYLLLDALHKHAPEVDLVALAPGPVEAPPGVTVVQTGGPDKPRRWRRSRQLREAMKSLDVFHSAVTATPPSSGPVLTATVHELPFVADYRLEGPRRAVTQWYWLSRAMGICRVLVAPSHATLRQMRVAHPASARIAQVVYHPAPPAPPCEQHAHDGSLLFVGRLDKRKAVEALIGGAAMLDGPVRLVGPHTEEGRLRIEASARRHGIRERVTFLGVVSDERLHELYCSACAVGLVSASEGFGFPVLEALARGVPVVVGEGTGAAEVGGDAALVVSLRSEEEIGAALRKACDPEYRAQIARLGPARVLEFTPERTARGYVEVFKRALAD